MLGRGCSSPKGSVGRGSLCFKSTVESPPVGGVTYSDLRPTQIQSVHVFHVKPGGPESDALGVSAVFAAEQSLSGSPAFHFLQEAQDPDGR